MSHLRDVFDGQIELGGRGIGAIIVRRGFSKMVERRLSHGDLTQSEPVGDDDERVQIFCPRRAWTITWTVCKLQLDESASFFLHPIEIQKNPDKRANLTFRAKNLMNLSKSFLSWGLRPLSMFVPPCREKTRV